MGIRREAREKTMQFLVQWDLNPGELSEWKLDLDDFWDFLDRLKWEELNHKKTKGKIFQSLEEDEKKAEAEKAGIVVEKRISPRAKEMREFTRDLIQGVLTNKEALDLKIQELAQNWDMKRIATVDRNILRLAVYELLYRNDIPPVVSINEAIDIAKIYSTDESGKFVNGILDRLKKELLRPARVPTQPETPGL